MKKEKRLADYGLNSERVLWKGKGPGVFEDELGELEDKLGLTTVEKAVTWAQGSSIWPDTFGLACCAIEMMSIVSARYDIARFGAEVFRSSPRQADLLIVSGRVAHKMAAPLRQIYDQMLEPKWVIAMGACASSGGMFNNYAVLQGVDKIVAVDIHVPGCPPRPEALVEGIVRLQEKIKAGVPPAYEIRGSGQLSLFDAVPGFVEIARRARRDHDRRRPGRLVEACDVPARRRGLQLPLGHRGRRLPRVGRARRRRLHRHRAAAATSTGPGSQGLERLPDPKPKRFAMNYHLLAIPDGQRVRVQVWLDEDEPVPSVIPVWPTADWHEREAYDLMGITVDGHPNLSRILLEDDWEGHPLRKDYPIGGEPVRFSGEE